MYLIQCFRKLPWTDFYFYAIDTEVVEKQAKEETVVENATPDYAAGLVSTQVKPNKTKTNKNQPTKKKRETMMHIVLKHLNTVMIFY